MFCLTGFKSRLLGVVAISLTLAAGNAFAMMDGGMGGGMHGGSTYSVGGTVSGLANGGTAILQNNGGGDITLAADGAFTFATKLADGAAYSVTVKTQPANQTCNVASGGGTINSANVTNVEITCGDGRVLLEGDPDTSIRDAVYNFKSEGRFTKPGEISVTENSGRIVRTKLYITFKVEATVGEINALLNSINGSIVRMSGRAPIIGVRIPDPGTLEALDVIIAQVEASPIILHVSKASMGVPFSLPNNYTPGSSSNLATIDHHLAIRASAAWNARAALKYPSSNPPLLIVDDYFDRGAPGDEYFDVEPLEPSDFANNKLDYHGYGVLSVISAKFGGSSTAEGLVTGIYPGRLDLRAVDISKSDLEESSFELIDRIEESNQNMLVNTSVGGHIPCGFPPDANCTESIARDWLMIVRGWDEYSTGTRDGPLSLENKFIHFSAAGNYSIMQTYDASLASRWNMARLGYLWNELTIPLPPLNNTLVIESRWNSAYDANSPYKPGELHSDSMYPGDFSAIGADVAFIIGPDSGVANSDGGTSFSTPQAAGLAAYVWALKPELTPQEVLAILERTATNKVIDAYAAVLAVDEASALQAGGDTADAPVRMAILDVMPLDTDGEPLGDGVFNEADLQYFLQKFNDAEKLVTAENPGANIDYSRFDLNGDGRTGGAETAKMNLDSDSSQTYEKVDQLRNGYTAVINEEAVTDLQTLCYYAWGPLYTEKTAVGEADTARATMCGHIAFGRSGEIYVINVDGSEMKNSANEISPDLLLAEGWFDEWSPDGQKILYRRIGELRVMSHNGSDFQRILVIDDGSGMSAYDPSWSFESTQVAFTAWLNGEHESINTINIYDGGPRNLTSSDLWLYNRTPAWSPVSNEIAFARGGDFVYDEDGSYIIGQDWGIFVISASGDATRRLTTGLNSNDGIRPVWSPDGSRIAFMRNYGGYGIYVMDSANGGNLKRLTTGHASTFLWSPDGSKIVFWGRQDTDGDGVYDFGIYVMDSTNGGSVRLTDFEYGSSPVWSPDGSKIAFYGNRDTDGDGVLDDSGIYIMDSADGGNVTKLTDAASAPAWRPAVKVTTDPAL